MALKGNKYGTHRVIEPKGVLTQAAYKIDNNMDVLYSNEIICDVQSLNIDSASFTQIEEACGGDEQKIGEMIMGIVAERGKQQNPVTGSGGMFIGTVAYIGEDLKDRDLKVGDKIASLVSLSLTPLRIDKILAVHKDIDRVDIIGKAVLFESGIYAKLPSDMSEALALAALDVAGAPAQARKLPKEGDSVLILGANGKSAVLCGYEAMKKVGPTGNVVGLVRNPKQVPALMELGAGGGSRGQRRQGVRHLHLLREPAQLRDERHPARAGRRPGVLLLHGHQLHQGGPGRRGRGQGREHDHRQRLHQGPR